MIKDTKEMETGIILAEGELTVYTQAIENLLAGFGYGNLKQVSEALLILGRGPEMEQLNDRVKSMLEEFHKSVWSVKSGLDPSAITMTSTNIPDAAKKLEYVLSATNDATHKLFGLVERQEGALVNVTTALDLLEKEIAEGANPASAVAEFSRSFRTQSKEVTEVLSEMVMTQEFQDLCGQALRKVLKLVQEMESNLRVMLKQFGIEIKEHEDVPAESKVTDQENVDDLLKEFGF
jgi:chemotaxis protein CheZ